MRPVQPEELSALLDGEMDAQREREIHAELAANFTLRAQFEALKHQHEECRSAAATAVFAPSIRLPAARASSVPRMVIELLLGMLVLVRFACRMFDVPALAWGLNAVAFIAMLTVTVWLLRAAMRSLESEPISMGGGS